MNLKKIISLFVVTVMLGAVFKIFPAEAGNILLKTISAQESLKLINENKNNKNFIILDVRTADEYNDGHIEGAINIDYFDNDFKNKLDKLDKSKKYLIYCRTGHRSGKAFDIMKDLNFKEVYNMDGGITVWKNNNFPLNK